MGKLIFFLFCLLLPAFSCTDGNQRNSSKGQAESAAPVSGVPINSYNNDTFYGTLKEQIINLSAAENIEEILCQGWVNADDLYDLETVEAGSEVEVPIRSYHFFQDYTFMRNIRNRLEEGKWKYDPDRKELRLFYNDGGGGDHFKIMAIATDELKIKDLDIDNPDIYTFIADAKRFINKMDDPFYAANNQWRNHPAKKESEEQLQKRIKDFLHFFILLYKDAIARESKLISFYNFPSCIKWYAGGIYLIPEKELAESWKNCFYNSAQAEKAYQVIGAILEKKYQWPKENINWIKKNLFVLEQMYRNL